MASLVKLWGPRALTVLLLNLAFPPFNFGLLVFVALIPWLRTLPGQTGKEAWKNGYGIGLLFALTQLHWLGSLTMKWTGSWVLGIIPTLVASFAMAVYYGLVAVLIRKCYLRNWLWAIPLVWAGVEAFRSYIPILAFPWNLLATPLWPFTPLNQAAYFGSIVLVSAWVMATNLLIIAVLDKTKSKQIQILGSCWMVVLALSLVRLVVPVSTTTKVVSAGQVGVNIAFDDQATQSQRVSEALNEFTVSSLRNGTELLVLPEGLAGKFNAMPPTIPVVLTKELPLLIGGQLGKDPTYQVAFAWDGTKWDQVKKSRLVIFGEFIPFRSALPFLQDAFRLPSGDLSASPEGVRALDLAGVRIGPIICFEALFPDIAWKQARNGAQLLTQMSIDDWYLDTTAADQLKASTVWRSIETGLPTVRAASQGYTMVTDRSGHILAEAPLFKRKLLRVEVPVPVGTSSFLLFPLFPIAAFIFSIWMLFSKPK